MALTITDPSDVRRILADAERRVPEADAESCRPAERFRAAASRFANGDRHDERRAVIEQRLAALDPEVLARTAARRTAGARDLPAHLVARTVPVASLGEHLGFEDPDDLPALVGEIAAIYASGAPSHTADDATTRMIGLAPDQDPELAVQLLVQAHLATAALIDGAVRAIIEDPGLETRAAMRHTLRREPPVPSTRRLGPDGEIVVLGLADPDERDLVDRDAAGSSLAFGAGPRACPAPAHALAIASAVVDVLRSQAAR